MSTPPAHWDSDVVLADGGTVRVRPIVPADGPALVRFHSGLSEDAIYHRYFAAKPVLTESDVVHLTTVDHADRVAFVVELGDELLAVARYERLPRPPTDAEVAFVVRDRHQGRGIGTVLLEYLASAARERGITRFVAETLADNRRMLDVFRNAGFDERIKMGAGVVSVALIIEPSDRSVAAVEQREHRAEALSVARLLTPRSVAVIGASRKPTTVGNQVFRNLLAGGFVGPVYPVNPGAEHVASVKAYPTVLDVPGEVELAVIAVPSPAVAGVIRQCAEKGVVGLVVLSAGFGEVGAEGVILLYLESFGNPRKFSRIARRVSRRKPIVAVKSGRSPAGVRAASSHTAAMATPDVAVDALFRQAGVIRVDTLDELFDMAVLLSSQPLPAGRRVAIVGNSGGPGILATDACDGAGLEVPELSTGTQAALREVIDPNGATANPVDLVAGATPAGYEAAIRVLLADEDVDAVIVVNTATFAAPSREIAGMLRRVAAGATKPIVGSFLAWPDLEPLLRAGAVDAARVAESGMDEMAVPAFASPEPAARALARAAAYGEWRRRPPGTVPDLEDFDVARARRVVGGFLRDQPAGGWLPAERITELLGAIGVAVLETVPVSSGTVAAAEASRLGFPVALKASGPNLVHKSDVGGVVLDLESAGDVAAAYREMAERVGSAMTGAAVQRMARPGVETIVGVVLDPLFGPLVMFGMGGIAVELLRDRAFRILPLTDADAGELVRSLRASPLLFGYRGSPPVAVEALEDVLQRVARLAAVVPELAELDFNPVIVSREGVEVVDCRVRIVPAPPAPDEHLRRLS